jgi:hypothetical protein
LADALRVPHRGEVNVVVVEGLVVTIVLVVGGVVTLALVARFFSARP